MGLKKNKSMSKNTPKSLTMSDEPFGNPTIRAFSVQKRLSKEAGIKEVKGD